MRNHHTHHEGDVITSPDGQYTLSRKLGEGGFGTSYLAYKQGESQPVVIKLLHWNKLDDWKAIELFEREGDVLQTLDHPNIPAYIDSFSLKEGDQPTGYALVQSYVEGQSLADIMESEQRLSPTEMLQWLLEIAEVCDYLHGQHPAVIHRDIKPGNIILRPDGSAALIDFGTVQAAMVAADTVSSTAAGTFGYAPMEQFLQRATPQSDLYGLGMTFVAVSTKSTPQQLPFVGNRLDVHQALRGSKIDARLVRLLEAMTHPDHTKRPEHTSGVLDTLRDIQEKPNLSSYSRSQTRRQQRDDDGNLPTPSYDIVKPSSFHTEEDGDTFTLSWRWFRAHHIFLLFFFICWDAFLLFWYGMVGNAPLIFSLFPLIHVAVGVAGSYYTLAGFLNKTTISIDSNNLKVRHTPLPWFGDCQYPPNDIEQLFCKEQINNTKNGQSITYEVHIIANGEHKKLIGNLQDPGEALYIERQIEDYLGIEDRYVPGQLRA
jgi:serine/threonine protein kinase